MDSLAARLASLSWLKLLAIFAGTIVTILTGVVAMYYGRKFTDERQARDKCKAEDAIWEKFETRFPAIARELHEDCKRP